VALTASLLVAGAFGQNNPVPQIVGPVHPDAVAPGGGDFTLSVYGANFVPGATVNWNYQARATTYISGHELQAQILSTDIANNTAGYITVVNPAPGGGSSSASWAQVEVHNPISTIAVDSPAFYEFGVWQSQAADFTHDAILDLMVGEADAVDLHRGNGKGLFGFTSAADPHYLSPWGFTYGDFNNDGNLDIAVASKLDSVDDFEPNRMDVMLGNGEGTFSAGTPILNRAGTLSYVLAGDFNQDGNLDLIATVPTFLTVYLGQGDGTFQVGTHYLYPAFGLGGMLAGNVNDDGKLDVILWGGSSLGGQFDLILWFLAGNGDGTFQRPQQIGVVQNTAWCDGSPVVQASDFNGDGKLDLAFCDSSQIGVMLGNGDGRFQPPTFYTADPTGQRLFTFAVGDINSDGKPDLIVSEYPTDFGSTFVVMLGNGDGTFQSPLVIASGLEVPLAETSITVGDFNADGLLDAAFQNDVGMYVYLQQ